MGPKRTKDHIAKMDDMVKERKAMEDETMSDKNDMAMGDKGHHKSNRRPRSFQDNIQGDRNENFEAMSPVWQEFYKRIEQRLKEKSEI